MRDKTKNLSRIILSLYNHGPSTRRQIAADTRLTFNSVSALLRDAMIAGLVSESPRVEDDDTYYALDADYFNAKRQGALPLLRVVLPLLDDATLKTIGSSMAEKFMYSKRLSRADSVTRNMRALNYTAAVDGDEIAVTYCPYWQIVLDEKRVCLVCAGMVSKALNRCMVKSDGDGTEVCRFKEELNADCE